MKTFTTAIILALFLTPVVGRADIVTTGPDIAPNPNSILLIYKTNEPAVIPIPDYHDCILIRHNARVQWLDVMEGKVLPDSADDFTKAIELADSDKMRGVNYELRGQRYAKRGEYAKALSDFNEALKVFPGSAYLYQERATMKAMLEDEAPKYGETLKQSEPLSSGVRPENNEESGERPSSATARLTMKTQLRRAPAKNRQRRFAAARGSAAVWNCTIDGLRMDKEACVQAAREYGYGGNDAVEAVFLLGKLGYEIHIW